jgi:mannan endo-1,4-beta-mannosidase
MSNQWPEQPPPSNRPPPKVAQRHKMNTWQKLLAIGVTILLVAGLGGYLFYRFGPTSEKALSTTPPCLQQTVPFCTGVALATVNRKEIHDFVDTTHVQPSMVEYYQRFGKPFSVDVANSVAETGARPFIQLNPHNVPIADIAAGKYDTYIRGYADAVKNYQLPIVLSFGHEMNGNWSSWSLPHTQPSTFIRAWQRIVSIFKNQGAINATWAWDISHGSNPPQQWYPGDFYVDWVGIDGYLRPGQTFRGQFGRSIAAVRGFAGKKPMFLAETAVAPGKQQPHQIHALFGGARRNHMIAVVWFNENKKEDWKLVKGSPGTTAFRTVAK